jgi:hypothetical protein
MVARRPRRMAANACTVHIDYAKFGFIDLYKLHYFSLEAIYKNC